MIQDNFAVFILTHGRAGKVETYKVLKKRGYTGKVYFVLDNEDDSFNEYCRLYGEENIIVFDKQAVIDKTDTMDNFGEHRAIIYARNVVFELARAKGLKYLLMLDDDYSNIMYRWNEGGKLRAKNISDMDAVFSSMIGFLEMSGADTVACAQGGDFVGGVDGGNFKKGLLRKAMNSFFCKVDNPIEFRGTMNEDVVTYTILGSRGKLFFTFVNLCVIQLPTQSLKGGMTEAYLESGTYLKTFYAVMSMPSCVKVSMMTTKHKRIHHHVNWECCVPKILNARWRKAR